MVFYFTATGNSLYVAKQLAAPDEPLVSIPQAIHDKEKTYRAETIGIVSPVFGHEVPDLVKKFLKQATLETPYFYLILTYGNRHGGAAELAEQMLEELGIRPSYINVVLMVDNFLPGFDMEEQKGIDKNIEAQIEAVRKDLCRRRNYIAPVTETDCAAHREYLTRMRAGLQEAYRDLYRITEDCIGCEICTKVCPEYCFTMDGTKSVWHGEHCIACMACIHACPMMAIRMNLPEKNPKARYRNENISICEIINANNQLEEKR